MAFEIELTRSGSASTRTERSGNRIGRLLRRLVLFGNRGVIASMTRGGRSGFHDEDERRAFERTVELRRMEARNEGGWL